mmetsp:Transcript_43615/g.137956  ORF Transcript_43615/g.137956 Transcript_43615/m.137956 type:complete len:167 (-) Transcript_43615:941-1441(-)
MTFEGNPSFASKHKFLQQYAHPGSFFGCFYSEDRERVIFERSFSWVQMMLLALGLTVGMLCLIMAVRQLVVLSKVLTENRERAPEDVTAHTPLRFEMLAEKESGPSNPFMFQSPTDAHDVGWSEENEEGRRLAEHYNVDIRRAPPPPTLVDRQREGEGEGSETPAI